MPRLPNAATVNRQYADTKRRLDRLRPFSRDRRAIERQLCRLRCAQIRVALAEEKRMRRAR